MSDVQTALNNKLNIDGSNQMNAGYNPTNPQDVATKDYVDNTLSSVAVYKGSNFINIVYDTPPVIGSGDNNVYNIFNLNNTAQTVTVTESPENETATLLLFDGVTSWTQNIDTTLGLPQIVNNNAFLLPDPRKSSFNARELHLQFDLRINASLGGSGPDALLLYLYDNVNNDGTIDPAGFIAQKRLFRNTALDVDNFDNLSQAFVTRANQDKSSFIQNGFIIGLRNDSDDAITFNSINLILTWQ